MDDVKPAPQTPGADLKAGSVMVTAVIQVTRAGTGKVDEYVLTGTVPQAPDQEEAP